MNKLFYLLPIKQQNTLTKKRSVFLVFGFKGGDLNAYKKAC